MARAQPISLLKNISGKLDKKEKHVFYVKYGKNFVWNNSGVHTFSAAQIANQTKMAQVAVQVATIMANSTQRAAYEAAFKAQSKYITIRGFITAQLYRNSN